MKNWRRLVLASVVLVSAGCSAVGPRYIESSRGSYLDVLALTDQQELLANLVRMRYAEAPVFIQIDGITASPSLRFDVDSELDVDSLVDGSTLKPRVIYEDNPTIVYTPLLGKEFSRELLLPLDPLVLLLLRENEWQLDELFRLLVSSINGIRNAPPDSARFDTIAETLGELSRDGGLFLGTITDSNAKGGEQLLLWLSPSTKATLGGQELMKQLGLDASTEVYPVKPGFRTGDAPISITMRPLYAVMLRLADMIDVPPGHARLATPPRNADAMNDNSPLLKIRYSESRPADALVSMQSRNVWYSVADSDLRSKRTLQTLRLLFNLQAQQVGGSSFQLSLPIR